MLSSMVTNTSNKKPKLYNLNTYIQAGIDPKTGLPLRIAGQDPALLCDNIKMCLTVMDEQDAINRYEWYNLPDGIDGELLERILYYRGQGMFFYQPELERFFFLPYTLEGSIDIYGRYINTKALPFNGSTTDDDKKREFPNSKRKVLYSLYDLYDKEEEYTPETTCVLLHDYCKGVSETNIARSVLNNPVLGIMSEILPMAETALMSNSGVKGIKVMNQDEGSNVTTAAMSVKRASLSQQPWIPLIGAMEMEDLTSAGTALKSEEYLLYLQALDNFRLSLYGLKNGGLFQKKSHMLEAEQDMNQGSVGLVYKDGLRLRQQFCDMVNGLFGLSIWVEAPEEVIGADMTGDGVAQTNQDQQGIPGDQPEMEGEANVE